MVFAEVAFGARPFFAVGATAAASDTAVLSGIAAIAAAVSRAAARCAHPGTSAFGAARGGVRFDFLSGFGLATASLPFVTGFFAFVLGTDFDPLVFMVGFSCRSKWPARTVTRGVAVVRGSFLVGWHSVVEGQALARVKAALGRVVVADEPPVGQAEGRVLTASLRVLPFAAPIGVARNEIPEALGDGPEVTRELPVLRPGALPQRVDLELAIELANQLPNLGRRFV